MRKSDSCRRYANTGGSYLHHLLQQNLPVVDGANISIPLYKRAVGICKVEIR